MVFIIIQMEILIKEHFIMINLKEQGLILSITETDMKDNLIKVYFMEKGNILINSNIHFLDYLIMRVSGLMGKRKESDN
jgi:hypothetical protein